MGKELIIKEVVKIIREYLSDDYKILLFGSWARGRALETSDIDIGILGEQKVPWSLMAKILEEVDKLPTLRKIDLIDLNSTEKSFRESVLKSAKLLEYARNF